MKIHTFPPGPIHLFRLPIGTDLYNEITDFAQSRSIGAATFTFFGAVRRASLRYYDQDEKEYRDFVVDRHLEILSGIGNVSLLDGDPFVHAHATLADEDGRAYGGHLNVGTEVFMCEVSLWELNGDPPLRTPDHQIGLAVWDGGT